MVRKVMVLQHISEPDAEDSIQEALCSLNCSKRIDKADIADSLEACLKPALNHARNLKRRRKTSSILVDSDISYCVRRSDQARTSTQESSRWAMVVLSKLADHEKPLVVACFVSRVLSSRGVADIAAMQGCTVQTAYQCIEKAKKSFRRICVKNLDLNEKERLGLVIRQSRSSNRAAARK
jgi:DNA-directed RNA polymerase specialized sigma24 family protein